MTTSATTLPTSENPHVAPDTTAPDEFDYTPFVLRTDHTYPPTDPGTLTGHSPDPAGVHQGHPEELLACIVGVWSQLSVPTACVAAMAGVLNALLAHLTNNGIGTLYEAADEDLIRFITTNPGTATTPTQGEMRLRRNTIHASYLALEDAGLIEPAELIEVDQLAADARTDQRGQHRHNAMPRRTRNAYDNRVHVHPATHDEVLLTRLASRLVGTSRGGQHLAAAAVAICSSTGTTSEAAQVRWPDHRSGLLTLPGRITATTETDIAPRVVTIDAWTVDVLADWHREQSTKRRFDAEDSMLYRGDQALTSTSASVCVDQQVRKAMRRAGLANTRGLTAGSLRLWAATKDATDPSGVVAGAERAGTRFATLHRQIHQLGERAF